MDKHKSKMNSAFHSRLRNVNLNRTSTFLSDDFNAIFTNLKCVSIDDETKLIALLESLLATLNSIKSTNQSLILDDFTEQIAYFNRLILRIDYSSLKSVDIPFSSFKILHLLLKMTKNSESLIFSTLLETLLDHLIKIKFTISNTERTEVAKFNDICLLLLKSICFISSKFSIVYDDLKRTSIAGKFVGIIRCFLFYGLPNFHLDSMPVHLYPTPLSQFTRQIPSISSSKKRKSKIIEDRMFDDLDDSTSPNYSTSECSSSELDESFSMLDSSLRYEFQCKKNVVKTRIFAYECLQQSLSIFDVRNIFGFWSYLFPDHYSTMDTQFSVLTTISKDPSTRVRNSALNFMHHFFDCGKIYVQILVQESSNQNLRISSFTPLSVAFTMMIKELHCFCRLMLLKESNVTVLILIYRILSLLISITPYNKLHEDILRPIFQQNSFLIENHVTQIKNLSLALNVKLFSLVSLPKDFENWIVSNEIGRKTIDQILNQSYFLILNSDFILLIIESIKLFIAILKHRDFCLKLFEEESIEFDHETLARICYQLIETDKVFNNSVLRNTVCKFIHSIGFFLKEIVPLQDLLFRDSKEKFSFIKSWYLKIFESNFFHQAIVEQDSEQIQISSQVILINTLSLIPENVFEMLAENLRFKLISILISQSKTDPTMSEYLEKNFEIKEQIIQVKCASIRCLSIIHSFDCCSEDINLTGDLIDICLEILSKSNAFCKLNKKKQFFLLEHITWSLANVFDCIKKTNLQSRIDRNLFLRIALIIKDLYADSARQTDDILINLARNSGLIIYLLLNYDETCDNDDKDAIYRSKKIKIDPKILTEQIDFLVEVLVKKKSCKLQWNICISLSYLLPLESFTELCSDSDLLDRIFESLFRTFMNTCNHKVQSYSIFTISSIHDMKKFEKHLQNIWNSLIDKFIENYSIVQIQSKQSWLDRFIFSLEKFLEYYRSEQINNETWQIYTNKLIDFIDEELKLHQKEDCFFDDKLNQILLKLKS
ncbi:RNA-binding protein fusilli [Sarcoptes scabiei]|nr:RNA-binding protein fusilli [Sarcoptes scabiei]